MALFIGFFFLPWSCFFLFSSYLESLDFLKLCHLLKKGIFWLASYGIFLFFYKFFTGSFIEIPLLTTNLHDFHLLEEKHIAREGFFKLIATYNNGNLYGISLFMLLPLYRLLEKRGYRKIIVIFSLILTFSRTIWIGLFFYFLLRRPTIGSFFSLLLLFIPIFSLLYFANLPISFLFDADLGGRITQLEHLETLSFLPTKPFYNIAEMVYVSVLNSFGILGLFFYLLAMLTPLFTSFFLTKPSEIKKAIFQGLFLFLILSISDGALLLIPVLAFYWILSSLAQRIAFDYSRLNGQ